jgi:hypothetical protein
VVNVVSKFYYDNRLVSGCAQRSEYGDEDLPAGNFWKGKMLFEFALAGAGESGSSAIEPEMLI